MSFALALSSSSAATAGRWIRITATRTGGSAWTNGESGTYPFSIDANSQSNGVAIIHQTTTGGNLCSLFVDLGNIPGPIVFADTVNSTTQAIRVGITEASHPKTGKTVYVQGGYANILRPTATIFVAGGVLGSTTYVYQITGVKGSTETSGCTMALCALGNTPQNANFTSSYVARRGVTINNGPATLDGNNTILLTWNNDPNLDSCNVWRSINGATPVKIGTTNIAGPSNSFTDNGATQIDGETLPVTNNTAQGNDTTGDGLSWGTAFATIAKACTIAVAGDEIRYRGFVTDNAQVKPANGVNLVCDVPTDTTNNGLYTTVSNSSNYPYVGNSNADWRSVRLMTDVLGQVIFGCGTSDPAFNDLNWYNCYIDGYSNAIRVNQANCGITMLDCGSISVHGTLGMTGAGVVINLGRTVNETLGTFITAYSQTITMNMQAGFLNAWDGGSTADTFPLDAGLNFTGTTLNLSGSAVKGFKLTNYLQRGSTHNVSYASGPSPTNIVAQIMNNTPVDPRDLDFINSGPTVINPGIYQIDPTTVPLPSNTRIGIPTGSGRGTFIGIPVISVQG